MNLAVSCEPLRTPLGRVVALDAELGVGVPGSSVGDPFERVA